ncbi:MAG: VWA domain-containing protein [Ignavibacteria bacterium]|nr:VWA domain-containing protein [Ignavibacteria bacterium]
MKYLFTLFLCLVSIQQADAQSISLFNIDASNFPTMKAKFYAFDAAGKQVRPSASELTMTESGQPRTITSVSCPPPPPPIAISSALTVDMSGSMGYVGGAGGTANIDLANAAARAWIQGLPAGQSECALSSFDDNNYLNQDFTTDRSRLMRALSTLSPNGGTNYNVGLYLPFVGSLKISERGKYKRVVVFLSDGLPNTLPDTAAIIAEAKRQNCIIFAVTLGMRCPQSLKDIASQTGGQFYENVTTTKDAEVVYHKIMQVVLGNESCEITWTSDFTCQARNNTIELTWQGLQSHASFTSTQSTIASLKVKPTFVTFDKRLPSTQNDTTLTLTAQNTDFTVTSISQKYGSADFTVVNTSFPLLIPKNMSKTITLRFVPSDSGFKYASIEIVTDKCLSFFSAKGGFQGKKISASTLKLTKPNGGENFVVGSDTVITWIGISPSEDVSLEYSSDNGATWKLLTTQATGLKYVWENVPKPTSTKCLVRVRQFGITSETETNAVLTLAKHSAMVSGVAYSPDGNRIATVSIDGTTMLWAANTGVLLRTLGGHLSSVNGVAYSPDGSSVATASFDETAKIWDANTGALLRTLTGHLGGVLGVAYSPDGSSIATAGMDETAKIWDMNTGALLRTIRGNSELVLGVAYSPDGSNIATECIDGTVKIWDATT